MTEIEILQQQNHRTFILVGLNFIMFLVLFFGLGYVAWQSSTLIAKLESDLNKVEHVLGQFQTKVQQVDFDTIMDKVLANTTDKMGDSVKAALNQSEFGGSLTNLVERVNQAHDRLESIGKSVKEANEKLHKIETEQLAQLVSYNILKGLGAGFTQAAESNKPLFETRE